MLKIKIYSGLSLSQQTVKKYLPQALFSKPIKRNDLYDDIKKGIHVIGIIDGEFLQNLSVSPTEIQDAMRCGLSIYGASSMGAMRAAELSQFGMIGCGSIFEQISKDPYFQDDKLGQIFYEDLSHVSMPFMDFFLGIKDLVQRRIVSPKESSEIVQLYKKLHFSERTYAALKSQIQKKHNSARLFLAFDNAKKHIISQKNKDAILMLKQIKSSIKQNQVILQSFKY
ncbi:MAG: TfuA-like protein [Pseudobdellovibrio sp.]